MNTGDVEAIAEHSLTHTRRSLRNVTHDPVTATPAVAAACCWDSCCYGFNAVPTYAAATITITTPVPLLVGTKHTMMRFRAVLASS